MTEPTADRLIDGDCIAGMQALPDGSIDLAFADPPFNIGYGYDVYHDRREADDYLAWSKDWIGEVARVLKPDGTFWLAIGDEFAAELKVIAHRDVGLHLRSWVIWYYTFGVNCKKKFSRSHAHLFHFVKDPKRFTFNDDAIRVPSARQLVYNDARSNPLGRLPDDTWILRPQGRPRRIHPPTRDTWNVSRVCGRTFQGTHLRRLARLPDARAGAGADHPGLFRPGRFDRPRPVRRQWHDAGDGSEARPPLPRLRRALSPPTTRPRPASGSTRRPSAPRSSAARSPRSWGASRGRRSGRRAGSWIWATFSPRSDRPVLIGSSVKATPRR